MMSNTFGGGTRNSELQFLTGAVGVRSWTEHLVSNSHIKYFNAQGYQTVFSHPNYDWVYHREAANYAMGFERILFMQNIWPKTTQYADEASIRGEQYPWETAKIHDLAWDDANYFEFLKNDFLEHSNKPYFHFGVSLKNHAPYSNQPNSPELLIKDAAYDISAYNMFNNYITGISETDSDVGELVDFFRDQSEPVLLVMFGDHRPAAGEQNIMYENLNIASTGDSAPANYYSVPYIFWANDKAKEVLEQEVSGSGPTLSPQFLIPELLSVAGLGKGSAYMQYLQSVATQIPVIHPDFYQYDGKITHRLPSHMTELLEEYLNTSAYMSIAPLSTSAH
jgi:phosphoglycerol transferase MdoB-like AlkP superfamily enzyme